MAWPAYVDLVVPEQVIGQDPDVVRSEFDDGFIRQEKRYTSALLTWQILALIANDADLGRFRAWADEEAHTWFTWADIATGHARQVRVRDGAGGITYTPYVAANQRRWEASMTLEGWAHSTV